jgi:hypothetical protein
MIILACMPARSLSVSLSLSLSLSSSRYLIVRHSLLHINIFSSKSTAYALLNVLQLRRLFPRADSRVKDLPSLASLFSFSTCRAPNCPLLPPFSLILRALSLSLRQAHAICSPSDLRIPVHRLSSSHTNIACPLLSLSLFILNHSRVDLGQGRSNYRLLTDRLCFVFVWFDSESTSPHPPLLLAPHTLSLINSCPDYLPRSPRQRLAHASFNQYLASSW